MRFTTGHYFNYPTPKFRQVGQTWNYDLPGSGIKVFNSFNYRLDLPQVGAGKLGINALNYSGVGATLTPDKKNNKEGFADYILREWQRHKRLEPEAYPYPWNLPGLYYLMPMISPLPSYNDNRFGSLFASAFVQNADPSSNFGSSAWKFPEKWIRAIEAQADVLPANRLKSLSPPLYELVQYKTSMGWGSDKTGPAINFTLGRGEYHQSNRAEVEKNVEQVRKQRNILLETKRQEFNQKLTNVNAALAAIRNLGHGDDPQNLQQKYQQDITSLKQTAETLVQALKENALLTTEEALYLANYGDAGSYALAYMRDPVLWILNYTNAKIIQNKLNQLLTNPLAFDEYNQIKKQVEETINQGKFDAAIAHLKQAQQPAQIVSQIQATEVAARDQAYTATKEAVRDVGLEKQKQMTQSLAANPFLKFDKFIHNPLESLFPGMNAGPWVGGVGGAIGGLMVGSIVSTPFQFLGLSGISSLLLLGSAGAGAFLGYSFMKG